MTPEELIEQWRRGLRISHRAHYEAAKFYEHWHWGLSLPTIVISASLGTTVFAGWQSANVTGMRTAMAILSVLTVVLTSLQGALRFAERSERHKSAAAQLGEVRRALEEQLVLGNPDKKALEDLRRKWDAADRQAPTIPSRIYNKTAKVIGELGDVPSLLNKSLTEA